MTRLIVSPPSSSLSSSYRYLPYEEVSGDIYDTSTSDDGSLNFFLGDATGHGVAATR